jgi:hypothetical protein
MGFNSSTYLSCLSIGCILILLFAVFRFIFREKYAEGLSRLRGARRERLLKTDRTLIDYFRILLWLSPVYLIVLPIALFFYEREVFPIATISMVLFVGMILQEYLFRKWLIKYMETQELPK